MAKVIARLERKTGEAESEFRERCGHFLLSVPVGLRAGESLARMTLVDDEGLRPDMAWGLAHAGEPLPSDTCFIASYASEDANLDVHPYASASAVAPLNPEAPPLMPHRMGLWQFSQVATARQLEEGHRHRWEVLVGAESMGFSDWRTEADAVADVHRRSVGNALHLCTPDRSATPALTPGCVLPSIEAVGSHLLFLRYRFAEAISLVNAQGCWSVEFAVAARAEGWALSERNGALQIRALEGAPDAVLMRAWSGVEPHQLVARTQLLSASPFEYAALGRYLQLAEDAQPESAPALVVERLRS